jgi:hypothetical protein
VVRYDVVGLLGRGGTAVVELALDASGKPVATKRVVLQGSGAEIRALRARLRREAEILRSLEHPAIVPVLDVLDDGEDVVVVLPALAENLADRVRRCGPLPVDEVERIGAALLGALAVAHRAGVVHRDVKPSNVLFDRTGRPALADFGVARCRDATLGLTVPGTVVGTPLWMAPEAARGEQVGPGADVFSLGATLRFALTGEGPYRPGPAATVLARAAKGEVLGPPEGLPGPLRSTLVSMLDPRPERRPSAAAALGGIEGTLVLPRPPTRRTRRRRCSQRPGPARRALALVAAAGLVAGVASATMILAGARGPGRAGRRRSTHSAACVPERYLPCGSSTPAPHTNGRACDPGWYDLDGSPADGCEAHSDFRAGTILTATSAVRANLVPPSATDTFATDVRGDLFDLCWGSLRVTLTAPAGTAERVTIWRGTTPLASALSAAGQPATATVPKPSCLGADSERLRVTVRVLAATPGASAADFTLRRNAGW